MDGKDRGLALALAAGADATTAGRFTGELILKGQAAKADGTSTKGQKQPEVKAAGWRACCRGTGRRVRQCRVLRPGRTGGRAIMHGMASERGGDLSKDDMDRAVRLAIGGSIVERNGQETAAAGRRRAQRLEKRIESVSADELRGQVGSDVVVAGGSRILLGEFVRPCWPAVDAGAPRSAIPVIVGGRVGDEHDRAAGADRGALMDFDHLEQVKALADAPMAPPATPAGSAWAPSRRPAWRVVGWR